MSVSSTRLTRRLALGSVLAVGAGALLARPAAAAERGGDLLAAIERAAADPLPSRVGDIVFWHIRTSDDVAAVNFYRTMFGPAWQIQEVATATHVVSLGGAAIGAIVGGQPRPNITNTVLYVLVDDVKASLAKAESLGAPVVFGPEVFGDIAIVDVLDPNGGEIGMFGAWRA